jgi:protein-tyrosine-phosphatase
LPLLDLLNPVQHLLPPPLLIALGLVPWFHLTRLELARESGLGKRTDIVDSLPLEVHRIFLVACPHRSTHGVGRAFSSCRSVDARELKYADKATQQMLKITEREHIPTIWDRYEKTNSVLDFHPQGRHYDFVIAVCSREAAERCPVSPGAGPARRLHRPFDDPSQATGSHEEEMKKVRKVRDQIGARVLQFVAEQGQDAAIRAP